MAETTDTHHIEVSINRDKHLNVDDGEVTQIMQHGHHGGRYFFTQIRKVSLFWEERKVIHGFILSQYRWKHKTENCTVIQPEFKTH